MFVVIPKIGSVDPVGSFEDFWFLHTSLCNACIIDVDAHSFLVFFFFFPPLI
jgi:hypothetical protein